MFGGGGATTFGATPSFGVTPQQQNITLNTAQQGQNTQPRDVEVMSPPDDSVSCLQFSPPSMQQIFLIAGSWDNNVCIQDIILESHVRCFERFLNWFLQVRCWEVERGTGKTVPKSMQSMTGPVLDVCWSDVSFFKIMP